MRAALRVANAWLAAERGEALAVALDGSAFRFGPTWTSVTAKPVSRALLDALVSAHLADRSRRLDKDTLGAALWLGEKLADEHRDNRLHVAVATLRKLGLGEVLVNEAGGFGLVPNGPLVRVDPRAMP